MGKGPYRKLSFEGNHRIALNGREIEYAVKRSHRARRVRLEIKRDAGLVAVLPRSFPLDELAGILHARQSWVCRHLSAMERERIAPSFSELKAGAELPYLGGTIRLVREGPGQEADIVYRDGTLAVRARCSNGRLAQAVEGWYRDRAADLLSGKAASFGAGMGLTCARITIRGQKTIWGSCSRRGALSFNWKLLMAPEPVIDYVIVHELAHLQEMNHGRDFWSLVAAHCPRWREYRKWLKENGALLCVQQ